MSSKSCRTKVFSYRQTMHFSSSRSEMPYPDSKARLQT